MPSNYPPGGTGGAGGYPPNPGGGGGTNPPNLPVIRDDIVLLLTGTGVGVVDSSLYHKTMSVTGTVAPATAPSGTFATEALEFDGGASDFVLSPIWSTYSAGTGDFTFQGWYYASSLSGKTMLFDSSVGTGTGFQLYIETNVLKYSDGSLYIEGETYIDTDEWHHIAASRLDGTVRIWVDGVENNSGASTTNITHNRVLVASDYNGLNRFTGFAFDVEYARSGVSTITVPTQALPIPGFPAGLPAGAVAYGSLAPFFVQTIAAPATWEVTGPLTTFP